MRKISIVEMITLDGVMQAPAGTKEDTRGGFKHGGWAMPYEDQVKAKAMQQDMQKEADLLFGRRTYMHLFEVWHGRKDDNPFTEVLDNTRKYVASRTLRKPLPWKNSTLLEGDAVDAIERLKKGRGKDLVILGSGKLVRALLKHNLIDEFLLLIHPLILGSGQRLFSDRSALAKLKLADSKITTTGVVIATYRAR